MGMDQTYDKSGCRSSRRAAGVRMGERGACLRDETQWSPHISQDWRRGNAARASVTFEK